VNWFYGANPYDEVVHLASGALAGAVFAALLLADGRRRSAARIALAGAGYGLGLGAGWEVFEWAARLIGGWTDTWTDVALTATGATLAAIGWRARSMPPGQEANQPCQATDDAGQGEARSTPPPSRLGAAGARGAGG
jgi:uncharacterized membrane protein YjdF